MTPSPVNPTEPERPLARILRALTPLTILQSLLAPFQLIESWPTIQGAIAFLQGAIAFLLARYVEFSNFYLTHVHNQ